MAMKETETKTNNKIIAKEGYARVRSHSLFSKWKKKHILLKYSKNTSDKELVILKLERGKKKPKEPCVIKLENVRDLEMVDITNNLLGLNILLKDNTAQLLAFDSPTETREWLELLKEICFRKTPEKELKDEVILKDEVVSKDEAMLKDQAIGKDEDSDDEVDCMDNTEMKCRDYFDVILQPSAKLNVSGNCSLQIIPGHIEVYDVDDPNMNLASWPINSMRRFGFDNSKFTFEAGRHCYTGEGIFVFKTKEGEQINKIIQSYAEEIAVQTRKVSSQTNNNGNDNFQLRTPPPIPPD